MTDAYDLIEHIRTEGSVCPVDATVETVVDIISSATPGAKKVLLEAIGKAMIRAEVERQAAKRAKAKAVENSAT